MLTWDEIAHLPRRPVADLTARDIPDSPGVYTWWRNDTCVYVGEAKTSLRSRLRAHLATGPDLSRSTLRRTVALEQLGIAREIAGRRPTQITQAQADVVNTWLRGCDLTWIECESATAAHDLETALRAHRRPPLNRT